ncbi:hypothetical protein BXY41_12411 [Lacrimispora xylanisolvens]|jgi:hypothetical protein|uniref:Uncharacterized protein n=1 Tax=Lacrimispora xylanisolvens TaxID=384636 RepID=A0A2S6HAM8_9FIRM|nr:hypothetical protein [Hungatella xylanolytica]MBE5990511.1 hypothetical protein [Paenibacillaceae bacterium]PPK74525.1 hypothetical protein BXY41_12411 [Hungatella xylanolytica]
MAYPISDFTATKIGENSSAERRDGMTVNSEVTINGSSNLYDIIRFNDNGCVYGITLTGSPGIYDYVLSVDAQGPDGFFSGSGHLAFTDKSGDTYKLSIYSSTRTVHTVRYNSKQPEIVKIQWNNESI